MATITDKELLEFALNKLKITREKLEIEYTFETVVMEHMAILKDKNDKYDLIFYTDGSCSNNGHSKVGGAAVCVYFPKNKKWDDDLYTKNIIVKGTNITNNVVELVAIKEALEIIINELNCKGSYRICSDSNYSVMSITSWYRKWIANNWTTSTGEKVKNRGLIKKILHNIEIIKNSKECKIIIEHVSNNKHRKPPAGCQDIDWIGNHMADELAKEALED